jgi:hypothetical protein
LFLDNSAKNNGVPSSLVRTRGVSWPASPAFMFLLRHEKRERAIKYGTRPTTSARLQPSDGTKVASDDKNEDSGRATSTTPLSVPRTSHCMAHGIRRRARRLRPSGATQVASMSIDDSAERRARRCCPCLGGRHVRRARRIQLRTTTPAERRARRRCPCSDVC